MCMRRPRATGALALTLTLVAPNPARAQLTFYDDLASFRAATSTTLRATFEAFGEGEHGLTLTENGIVFTNVAELWTTIGYPINPPAQSIVLLGNGQENIDITFPGLTPTAVGFDTYTNKWGPPVVSVYSLADVFLGSYALAQGPNTFGFFGVTATEPIGRVNWLADLGDNEDTAIDNVRIGSGTVTPEPLSVLLLGTGLAGLVGAASRSSKQDAEEPHA